MWKMKEKNVTGGSCIASIKKKNYISSGTWDI